MDSDRGQFDSTKSARTEMEALAIAAVAAVQKAEMAEEVNHRLFHRPPAELFEPVGPGEQAGEQRYRLMVELLLREIAAVGAVPTIDAPERQSRIRWALEMAGF
jgi:hypothetical protein